MTSKRLRQHGFTRRQSLGIAGATGAALLLGGGRRGPFDLPEAAVNGDIAEAATNCTLTANATEGPYWVDERLNRPDVTGDRTGIPLTLNIAVFNAEESCSPYEGAVVDIWHASSAGHYSDESSEGTSGQTWLRGYQVTDSNGAVQFKSFYPGYYTGRAVHIHVRVRTFSGSSTTYNFTTQIFFDESINTAVAATAGYSHGTRTTNAQDSIYDNQTALIAPTSGDTTNGYTSSFSIGLSGLPASNSGAAADSSVGATLLSAKVGRTPRGRRVLKLRLKATEKVSVAAKLQRGSKERARTLAKRPVASFAKGTHLLKLPIPDGAKPGAARLNLGVKDSSGNSEDINRQVHIPSLRG